MTATPVLRPARLDELAALTALCRRSKAYWGYDKAFMDACLVEMTIDSDDLSAGHMIVCERGGKSAGVAHVETIGSRSELHLLYVDPPMMGKGIGGLLMRWAMEQSKREGAMGMELDADPHAADFYAHYGAQQIGWSPSGSIAGRRLPRMRLGL